MIKKLKKPGGEREEKREEKRGKERGSTRKIEKFSIFSFGISFPHNLTFRQIAANTNQMNLFTQSWTWWCFGFLHNLIKTN